MKNNSKEKKILQNALLEGLAKFSPPSCIGNLEIGMISGVGGDNIVRKCVGCPLGSDENIRHKGQK